MKFVVILLFFLIPATLCITFNPEDWKSAKSPLTSSIYKNFLSKIQPAIQSDSNPREGRITHGKTAKLGQIPHQILLYANEESTNQTYLCGGSIISSQWILTAAHCIYNMSSASVFAGIIDRVLGPFEWGVEVSKTQLIPHELYDPENVSYDIGLIGPVNITFSNFVKKISIPNSKDAEISLVRRAGDISGWGLINDQGDDVQYLQYAQGPIIHNKNCVSYYADGVVDDSHVCMDTRNRKSTCSGDSGGPLSTMINARKVLVGIVSFGSIFGCELGLPDVFTRVSSHLDWITDRTGM